MVMSAQKRPRATFEDDAVTQKVSHVLYGTPLPPPGSRTRDDGSYVPVWKQEVRDERGRKRLHGAFTGGWSAGYFNTVGSKEGWTPSTFVSSRTNRRKNDPNAPQQRPEDFMDEEDLADAEEARKLQTREAYAGLGTTEHDARRSDTLADLLRVEGETMGVKLLKRMGWKEGQGIGPRIRRTANLDVGTSVGLNDTNAPTHLFAPPDTNIIAFAPKYDRRGLGYDGHDPHLWTVDEGSHGKHSTCRADDSDEDGDPLTSISGLSERRQKVAPHGGIGLGVLNESGSDDEDPYEIRPKISYNRTVGSDKKKKKQKKVESTSVNPSLGTKPVFMTKKRATRASVDETVGKTTNHHSRLEIQGFVWARRPDALLEALLQAHEKYVPPKIPTGWKSSRQSTPATSSQSGYVSTAEVARASVLDPRSRGAMLGEAQLPGKSVFDFLSPEARDRLVMVTGKTDLPPAKGEVPAGHALSAQQKYQQLVGRIPRIDHVTATAAAARSAHLYADDEAKRFRYRTYLEFQSDSAPAPAKKPDGMTDEEWIQEFHEFASCARLFQPMTGPMASRFTMSSAKSMTQPALSGSGEANRPDDSSQALKVNDAAEEAAKLGMFGHMTRSIAEFYPTRLLCKRFNVKPPRSVQPKDDKADEPEAMVYVLGSSMMAREFGGVTTAAGPPRQDEQIRMMQDKKDRIDSSQNGAVEGQKAAEEVLKAIFGEDDDDD